MLAPTIVEAARRFGERPALVAEGSLALTYGQLDAISDEIAAGLVAQGLGEGSVVALVVGSIPEHFVLYGALAKIGAITAAVNHKLSPIEREQVIAVVGAEAVLCTEELAPSTGHTLIIRPADSPEEVAADLRRHRPVVMVEPDPDRPSAIVFTSGTTGLPKGAVFCGRQVSFITSCDVGDAWGTGGKSVAGSAPAHLGPMTKFAGNVQRGNTQYLSTSWRANEALAQMERLQIAAMGGVPTQLALMLAEPDFDRYDLSSVKAVIMGGGPATPTLIRSIRERMKVPVAVRYSCTEAGIGTGTGFSDPDEDAEVSVGRAQPGVELTIVDEAGLAVADGVIGEVCLRSPAVMSGYWGDDSGHAFTSTGAVKTGDLGFVDEVGRLHLAGRSRERYVRGAYNVYPMEVEAVLAEHPRVRAVTVVSRPDDVMGEIGIAVVVTTDGAVMAVDDLRSFAEGRLAHYKLPDRTVVVDELPLTAGEKVDRRRLEAMVRDHA